MSGTTPICIFLGAGADIEAGGLTFRQLKQKFVSEYRDRPYFVSLSLDLVDHEFERILARDVPEADRAAVLDGLFNQFESLKPSEGHLLLALLAKHGAIDCVVTTNFDNLLEKGEALVGGRIFQIFAPGVALPDIREHATSFPRPLYLKLHGDIEARTVTHITKVELENRTYLAPLLDLTRMILQTHRLFFVGYSGYDEVFARLVTECGVVEPVSWISPSPPSTDAPLIRALGEKAVTYVKAGFGEFMRAVAEDALATLDLTVDPPIFLQTLVANKIRTANSRYLGAQHAQNGEARARLLIPRRDVERRIESFISDSSKTLAVLAGPSGTGKSTIIARLCDRAQEQAFPPILVLRAQSMDDADVARRIVSEIERGAFPAMPRLFEFGTWLQAFDHDLLVVIDGINEFSPRVEEVGRLVRGIVEILLRLRPNTRLKILITIRQETWNEVFPFLDVEDLRRVLWTGSDQIDRPNVISLGTFNADEVVAAFNAYARFYKKDVSWHLVPPAIRHLLTDPFMMRFVMTEHVPLTGGNVNRRLMRQALYAKLETRLSPARAQSLLSCLTKCAAYPLANRNTFIAEAEFAEGGIRDVDLSLLVDLAILSRTSDGVYKFQHDRVLEYFLSMAIDDGTALRLDDLEDLADAVLIADRFDWIRSALLSCFVTPDANLAEQRRSLIEGLVALVGGTGAENGEDTAGLRLFMHDVLLETARQDSQLYSQLYRSVIQQPQNGNRYFQRLVVRAAAVAEPTIAFGIWIDALQTADEAMRVEAEILLYDRIASEFLESWQYSLSALDAEPLCQFFSDPKCPAVLRATRLLGIATRLGPDNLSPREWAACRGEISKRLSAILGTDLPPTEREERKKWIEPVAALSNTDANRILFNARMDWIEQYFMNENRRSVLQPMFEHMEQGVALSANDFRRGAESSAVMGRTIDFMIMNLLWALSYRRAPGETAAVFDAVLASFDARTPVEILDIFLSCVFTALHLNGEDTSQKLERYTREMVKAYPQMVLVNPGQTRSQMRGQYLDDFDQQFEDGFNPLAFYFYDAPSAARRKVSFTKAKRENNPIKSYTPLYTELLGQFERERQPKGIIRIIHAQGQMISIWPREGLNALRELVGRREPTVRRSVVRVLAESFARFPLETEALINSSGASFERVERNDICCVSDVRMAQRTFEQLQWCRVLQMLEWCCGKELLSAICCALIGSGAWWEAVAAISAAIYAGVTRSGR